MKESLIEARLVRKGRIRPDCEVRKVKWLDRNGAPDRIVMAKGFLPIFVECKTTGKKPSSIQLREHARMRNAGQVVVVVDSFEGVDAVFAALDTMLDTVEPRLFGYEEVHRIYEGFFLAHGLGVMQDPTEVAQLNRARQEAVNAYRKARDLV